MKMDVVNTKEDNMGKFYATDDHDNNNNLEPNYDEWYNSNS